MKELKEVYLKLEMQKKERRELTKMFKDQLVHDEEYERIVDEMDTLKERKKSIETAVRAASLADAERLDVLKDEIQGNNELLADIALTQYIASETVEIIDEYGTRYLPEFKVNFKKDAENVEEATASAKAEITKKSELVSAIAERDEAKNGEVVKAKETEEEEKVKETA